ncbi:MAG: OsmC family protein [Cyclobacteriaceae bacterium]|jgi:putative redox protein
MHIKTAYQGQLRTKALHNMSGNTLLTDAPTDNNGKGETFSPTDLVAAALASCMMTIMGIEGQKMGFDMDKLEAETEKVMSVSPRKISKLRIHLKWSDPKGTSDQRQLLKEKALTCPVALSLSEQLKQEITFSF